MSSLHGRHRRHHPTSSSGSSRQSSLSRSPQRRRDRDYYDDSDEENTKRHAKSQNQMYNGACSLGRFCLNPCLCLATTVRMICCRPRQEGSPRARQRPLYRKEEKQRRSFTRASLLLLAVCAIVFWPRRGRQHPLRHKSDSSLDRMPVLIKLFDYSNVHDIGGWHYHGSRKFHSTSEPLNTSTTAEYDGLAFSSLRHSSKFRRRIAQDDDKSYEEYKKKLVLKMDEKYLRSYYDQHEERLELKCRAPNFAALYFPNCNAFHEFDLSRDPDPERVMSSSLDYYDSYQFAHGYYRDAWMLRHADSNATENNSVLKTLRMKHDFSVKDFMGIQKDSLVMERLTSSPRILNMHGHCSTSMLVQPIPFEVEEYVVPGDGMMSQKELDEYDDVKPMNSFTVAEKLDMALEMAESIADLHGYKGGVIVHDDVQLCQWLRGENGHLILGDFNRAEVMDWNSQNKSYCKYKNGYVYGNYRSPEEMRDDDLDEKIDVYSFGNNIYALLTGLWVFYENDDDKVVQEKVTKGHQRAFIDDRYRNHSYGEGKLVELMEQCWKEDPSERVDIFEAVRFLREAVEENKKRTT